MQCVAAGGELLMDSFSTFMGHMYPLLYDSKPVIAAAKQVVLQLFRAATSGSAADLERLLQQPNIADHVNCEDEEQWTPLHHAVDGNHLAAAVQLLAYKADVNAMNCSGDTPLLLAVRWSFIELAQVLLMQPAIDVTLAVRPLTKQGPLHCGICTVPSVTSPYALSRRSDKCYLQQQGLTVPVSAIKLICKDKLPFLGKASLQSCWQQSNNLQFETSKRIFCPQYVLPERRRMDCSA
jgi:hypothetical protein